MRGGARLIKVISTSYHKEQQLRCFIDPAALETKMKRYILKITTDSDMEEITEKLKALGCEIQDVLRTIHVINFLAEPEQIETIKDFPEVSDLVEDRQVSL